MSQQKQQRQVEVLLLLAAILSTLLSSSCCDAFVTPARYASSSRRSTSSSSIILKNHHHGDMVSSAAASEMIERDAISAAIISFEQDMVTAATPFVESLEQEISALQQQQQPLIKIMELATTTNNIPVNEAPAMISSMLFWFEDVLLNNPAFWSSCVMLSIVSLLYAWETVVHNVRQTIPKPLLPVIESILAELGGLGFVGLFLEVGLPVFGDVIGGWSERYLGQEEILLETFEYLHEAFFQAAITFFGATGLIVASFLSQIRQFSTFEEEYLMLNNDNKNINDNNTVSSCYYLDDTVSCYTNLSLDTIADITNAPTISATTTLEQAQVELAKQHQPMSRFAFQQWTMSEAQRGAEAFVVRRRFMDTNPQLPPSFNIERYVESVFGANLLKIVELSPLVWLPLIPLLAVDNAIDLEKDIVNVASANAVETAGLFFADPWALGVSIVVQVLSVVWGGVNFWKMAAIKRMVQCNVVRDNNNQDNVMLLPPFMNNQELLDEFSSTPAFLRPFESLMAKPARNVHESLFGTVGANGPKVYLSSIKYHLWLCITIVFFFGTEVLPRDIYALFWNINGDLPIGDPQALIPETVTYSFFIVVSLIQLSFASVSAADYSYVTSVEQFTKETFLQEQYDVTTTGAAADVTTTSAEQTTAATTILNGETTTVNGAIANNNGNIIANGGAPQQEAASIENIEVPAKR